jgi:hypothetical protein
MRRPSTPAESVAGVGLMSAQVHGVSESNCPVLKAADALCASLRESRDNRKTATAITRTHIVGPLLGTSQTAREEASRSSDEAEFGILASTSHADSRRRLDNRVASIAVVQRPLLAHETRPAPLVFLVVHRVTPTRERHRTCGRRANLWLDLHVKTLAGHCLDVRLTRDATPRDLKAELHGLCNIPPVNQRMMWGASEMRDHEPVCDQGVFTGSTLHLVMRCEGGGPQGKGDVVFVGTKLGAEKPLPDASESLYAGCFGRF